MVRINKICLFFAIFVFTFQVSYAIEYCSNTEELGSIIEESYYCVKPGDSLSNIFYAHKNQISFDNVEEFGDENSIENINLIYVRQKLYLSSQSLISKINPFSDNYEITTYTVKDGDTLTGIYNNIVVKNYGNLVGYNEFIQWNVEQEKVDKNNLDLIQPDDEIIIGYNEITSLSSKLEEKNQLIDKTNEEEIINYISEIFNVSSYYVFSYTEFLETKTDTSIAFIVTNEEEKPTIVREKLIEFDINQYKHRYFFFILEKNNNVSSLYYNRPSFSNFLNEFLISFRDTSQALDSAEETRLLNLYEREKLEQQLEVESSREKMGLNSKVFQIQEELSKLSNERIQAISDSKLRGEVVEIQTDIGELKEEIENINDEIEEKQTQLRGNNRPDDISNINVEELRGDISRLEKSRSNKEAEIEELENRKNYLINNEKVFSQNKETLEQLYEEFEELRYKVENIKRENLANEACPAKRYSYIQSDIEEINELYRTLSNQNYLTNKDLERFAELYRSFTDFQYCLSYNNMNSEIEGLVEEFESITQESRCSDDYLSDIRKRIEEMKTIKSSEDIESQRSEIENDINICGTDRFGLEVEFLKKQSFTINSIIVSQKISDSQINECRDSISLSKKFKFKEIIDKYSQKYENGHKLSKNEFQELIETSEYHEEFSICIT